MVDTRSLKKKKWKKWLQEWKREVWNIRRDEEMEFRVLSFIKDMFAFSFAAAKLWFIHKYSLVIPKLPLSQKIKK